MVSECCWSLELLVSGAIGLTMLLVSGAIGLWCFWSLELVNVCVWFAFWVVLLGFGGCGVVVWCQGGGSLELLVS